MPKIVAERPHFTTYGLSCVRWNPSPMWQPDHHNEIQLNLLVRGRVTYLLGAGHQKVPRAALTAFWAAIPHQIVDYEPDTEYYVATLPLAWFLQCELPDSVVQPLMRGEVLVETDPTRADIDAAQFRQWERDLDAPDASVREIVFLEMKTRLRRLAVSLEAHRDRRRRPVAPPLSLSGLNKVERMVCFVAQNYMDAITAEDIGRAAGMHPNAAMRLFRKAFGKTLVDQVTENRVFHAKRLLATTDQKIVDVAFGSGFNSISRFNDAFRRACGCTPREYRLKHEALDTGAERAYSHARKKISAPSVNGAEKR